MGFLLCGKQPAGIENDGRPDGALRVCGIDVGIPGILRKMRGQNPSGEVYTGQQYFVYYKLPVRGLYAGSGSEPAGLCDVRALSGNYVAGYV